MVFPYLTLFLIPRWLYFFGSFCFLFLGFFSSQAAFFSQSNECPLESELAVFDGSKGTKLTLESSIYYSGFDRFMQLK